MTRTPLPIVLVALVRTPRQALLAQWNWKSAICSSLVRAALFAATNAAAGPDAAVRAALVELSYRAVLAGFYGAVTQSLSRADPPWLATLTAVVLLPAAGHLAEFAVHWWAATARLAASIVSSIALSVLSTLFNLYAMRRGALTVGAGETSLLQDLRRMPGLVCAFLLVPLRGRAR